eukprot:3586346-Prorocentrum_lima.AAC.1
MQIFTLAKSQLAFRELPREVRCSSCTWWGGCKVFWAKPEATVEHEVGKVQGVRPKQRLSTNLAT